MEGCMIKERKEMMMCEIINQLPDLYLADLVQVADLIRRLKASR
jgi:hypothetical protein